MQPKRRRPLCRFVATTLFHSPLYLRLPEDGQSRFLFVFLLLHPLGGTFHTPGLYQVGPDALREAARMPRRSFTAAYNALLQHQVMEEDARWRLLWMPVALDIIAPPSNPNIVKGICRSLGEMPACSLLEKAKDRYAALFRELGEPFLKPFQEAFGNPDQSDEKELTKLNSDQDLEPLYTDTHNRQDLDSSNSEASSTVTVESLMAYASAAGWAGTSRRTIERNLRQTHGLKWEEVHSSRQVVDAREGVADPISYLFGIIRATRAEDPTAHRVEGMLDDAFRGLRDGQKVQWYSP